MTEVDDHDLVVRCRRGDERAFQELVDRYKDLVYALLVRAVPDRAQVEDLAQEAFLRVYRGLPYFRGEARLSTWIYRIVANLCAGAASRSARHEISLDSPAADPQVRIDPGADDRTFSDFELRERLEKALARLPSKYRLLIAGYYMQGLKYEELAAALDIPLGTVKTHLFRAKRALRQMLDRD